MAGIGFTLQKLFRDDYLSLRVRAYAYASFIAAGPWILSVGSIAFINVILVHFANVEDNQRQLFIVTVSYCFIFSQMLSGGWQLCVTRYLADHFFHNRLEVVTPTYIGISRIIFGISLLAAVIFYWSSPLSILYKVMSVLLFFMCGQIWLAMVFLTAAKDYKMIAIAFLAGAAVSIGSVFVLLHYPISFTQYRQSTNILLGFSCGMLLTMAILVFVLLRAFPARTAVNPYGFLQYVDKYPSLLWTGFLYNIGVWTHNMIIWLGSSGVRIEETFRYSPIYDTSVFLANLTVIPSLVLFVVSVETEFYDKYKTFYGYVTNGGTLEMIQKAKKRMVEVLWRELYRLTKLQGILTVFIILISEMLLELVGLQKTVIDIFKLCALGALLNAIMLIHILLMLYFEDRKGAVITGGIYFGLNVLLTAGLLPLGFDYYGFSYFLAGLAAYGWSGYRLLIFLKRIEVHTFISQSIIYKEKSGFFARLSEKVYLQRYFK
ncbi:exopolysaccharide Pel transporter PelG [Paenibacillus aceris]|uniref:Membrane protein n=1 Tax=Paenibacillus aceris TaxID=869555 RepID=A0ABS4I9W7_9BACL|nr:exopolysaccharide Pel transporter PelG [Paenibacillus aceris]MBP1967724.1 putative membrane protein [Paenibacillus aceris]NHW39101.1 exopolysaccharide Pel transporter PelG [Paenibacillus aceris]